MSWSLMSVGFDHQYVNGYHDNFSQLSSLSMLILLFVSVMGSWALHKHGQTWFNAMKLETPGDDGIDVHVTLTSYHRAGKH